MKKKKPTNKVKTTYKKKHKKQDPPQKFELQMCKGHHPINILQQCETKDMQKFQYSQRCKINFS